MTSTIRRLAASFAAASPLAAAAAVLSRSTEGPAEPGAFTAVLGAFGPVALWGLPLAYVIFTVVSSLRRRPGVQEELEEPREATLTDRLTLTSDTREGW